jgi:hypothetical protein
LHTAGAIAQVALNLPNAYVDTASQRTSSSSVAILSFERASVANQPDGIIILIIVFDCVFILFSSKVHILI